MDSSASPNPRNIEVEKDAATQDNQSSDTLGKRKAPSTPSGASSQAQKIKKVVVARSGVWKHYTRTKEDRDKCHCHYCKKPYACASKSGTSNLKKHLAVCKEYLSWRATQVKSQTVISNEGGFNSSKVSELVFREASNELMVLSELPLSFIESSGWKHFSKKVNLYFPHSRRIATRDIVKMFINKKEELKKWLSTNKQRVSLTTDIWTSQITGASYMVVTAHFIDATWQLKKLIHGFKYVLDHKGQTISTILLECLSEWGIEKVFCITVDNATANTSVIRKFHREFSAVSPDAFVLDESFLHMRCSAHIINLIAKEGLTDLGVNVMAIRNAVQYVRSSTHRLNAFDLKVTSGKMTRGSLPLDVKTRWNSTFLMLSRALQFRVAFNRMEAEDRLYNDYFLEVENGNKRCGPPSICDWNAVEKLNRFLVIFYNSTLVVSASSKVNAYKCYGEIVAIERNLTSLASSLEPDLNLKAYDMLEKFLKYWDGIKNVNKMLIVATIVDPRKKMVFAKLCFDKLYGKNSLESKDMATSLFDLVSSMFKEYASRFRGSVASSSQSTQASSMSAEESQEQAADRMELVVEDFGYERMDYVYKELIAATAEETKDELDVYLKEPVENPKLMMGLEFDILSWWKVHKIKYPILAEMARDLLAMQVSSVASESAFSTSGRILEPHRSCLTHYMIEVLMCIEQWMQADITLGDNVVTNQQLLAEVEMLDKLEKEFQNVNLQDS